MKGTMPTSKQKRKRKKKRRAPPSDDTIAMQPTYFQPTKRKGDESASQQRNNVGCDMVIAHQYYYSQNHFQKQDKIKNLHTVPICKGLSTTSPCFYAAGNVTKLTALRDHDKNQMIHGIPVRLLGSLPSSPLRCWMDDQGENAGKGGVCYDEDKNKTFIFLKVSHINCADFSCILFLS